jgi:hypothetical protein
MGLPDPENIGIAVGNTLLFVVWELRLDGGPLEPLGRLYKFFKANYYNIINFDRKNFFFGKCVF